MNSRTSWVSWTSSQLSRSLSRSWNCRVWRTRWQWHEATRLTSSRSRPLSTNATCVSTWTIYWSSHERSWIWVSYVRHMRAGGISSIRSKNSLSRLLLKDLRSSLMRRSLYGTCRQVGFWCLELRILRQNLCKVRLRRMTRSVYATLPVSSRCITCC